MSFLKIDKFLTLTLEEAILGSTKKIFVITKEESFYVDINTRAGIWNGDILRYTLRAPSGKIIKYHIQYWVSRDLVYDIKTERPGDIYYKDVIDISLLPVGHRGKFSIHVDVNDILGETHFVKFGLEEFMSRGIFRTTLKGKGVFSAKTSKIGDFHIEFILKRYHLKMVYPKIQTKIAFKIDEDITLYETLKDLYLVNPDDTSSSDSSPSSPSSPSSSSSKVGIGS